MAPPHIHTSKAALSSRSVDTRTTLERIDNFIPSLPREYRTYAYLIRSIAIDPEYALTLQVKFVEELWQRHGFVHATRLLSSVPPSESAPYLLVTEIRGRRLQTLRRNGIATEHQPSQVFLDYKARPITMAMATAAFIRASRRHDAPSPISPALIREIVLFSMASNESDCELLSHDN